MREFGFLARQPRLQLWALAIAGTVVGLDRVLKLMTQDLLQRGHAWPSEDWPVRFVHAVNTGAAFGILRGQTSLLVIVSAIGIVLFGYALLRSPWQLIQRLGLSLGLGGAIANFIDRVSTGEVVDSLKIAYWPAFNLADVAITFGVALILWNAVRDGGTPDEGSDHGRGADPATN